MILSDKGITKMLIRLPGCGSWSTHLFVANLEDSFSRVKAQDDYCPLVLITYLFQKKKKMVIIFLVFVEMICCGAH